MTIQVTGMLTDSSGAASPNTPLLFVTIIGYEGALRTATFDTTTDGSGNYDFPLAVGKHVIYVKYGDVYEELGSTIVNSETVTPLTISQLLKLTEPLTAEEIKIVTQLVEQAQQAANEAANSAQSAAEDAAEVEATRQEVENNAATVQENTDTVLSTAATVENARQEVAANTVTVQENTDIAVNAALQAAEDAVQTNSDREQTGNDVISTAASRDLAKEWAIGDATLEEEPSSSNNARYYSEVARNNANQTFKSGGYFTPTAGTPYPDVTSVEVDTIWLITFASAGDSFTYSSGELSGETVENGYMLVYDTPDDTFAIIPTTISGVTSVNGELPDQLGNINITADEIYLSETESLLIREALQILNDNKLEVDDFLLSKAQDVITTEGVPSILYTTGDGYYRSAPLTKTSDAEPSILDAVSIVDQVISTNLTEPTVIVFGGSTVSGDLLELVAGGVQINGVNEEHRLNGAIEIKVNGRQGGSGDANATYPATVRLELLINGEQTGNYVDTEFTGNSTRFAEFSSDSLTTVNGVQAGDVLGLAVYFAERNSVNGQDKITVVEGSSVHLKVLGEGLSQYKIPSKYVETSWKQFARNEAQMEQMRQQNMAVRAASGFDHYGKHWEGSAADNGNINEGLWCASNNTYLALGRNPNDSLFGESKTTFPVNHIAGFISSIVSSNPDTSGYERSYIKFPEAPDGTVTYNSATGEVIKHADASTAFALADTSDDIEVVINRVDMFGAEFFLEEVSQTNPFVYPKGMIQSQATSMNGITTTTSNRPVTYYAVYDGDTGSQGLGVDFWAATDEQKKAMVSDETNNIFMLDDGRLVQWRMRQRTIAGGGNGKWANVKSSGAGNLRYSDVAEVFTQGYQNIVGVHPYAPTSSSWRGQVGIFETEDPTDNTGINYECYFHVWGVVPRLNQGVKHWSFNDMGSAKATDGFGYQSALINSTLDCFLNAADGSIAGADSGRDDGKFYDGIYSSGQGGVIDYRKPAKDMSGVEEKSKVFQKVVNGTYRGKETLTKMHTFISGTLTGSHLDYVRVDEADISGDLSWVTGDSSITQNECTGTILLDGNPISVVAVFYSSSVGQYYFAKKDNTVSTASSEIGKSLAGVVGTYTNIPVSGNFTMQDVIGDPANILAVPQLANGWIGGWIPVIPDGTTQWNAITATRKRVDSGTLTYRVVYSDGSYTLSSHAWTDVINAPPSTITPAVGTIEIWGYNAFAKQTVQSTNKPVLNGNDGIGDVIVTNSYLVGQGVLLNESVTGNIGTGSDFRQYRPLDYVMDSSGNVSDINTSMTTLPTDASEIQTWQISNDQECSLMFYDGTNYHELAISYGYSLNQAGAGTQGAGVDL